MIRKTGTILPWSLVLRIDKVNIMNDIKSRILAEIKSSDYKTDPQAYADLVEFIKVECSYLKASEAMGLWSELYEELKNGY